MTVLPKNILMLGWEFPPEISGGLGVACYNITKYLAPKTQSLRMILPTTQPITSSVSQLDIISLWEKHIIKQMLSHLTFHAGQLGFNQYRGHDGMITQLIKSPLQPYFSDVSYQKYLQKVLQSQVSQHGVKRGADTTSLDHHDIDYSVNSEDHLGASGHHHYGYRLCDEVIHYTHCANELAALYPFDIIHCHDWMTVLAGIEIKKASHKPLVFHVHSLEYDRSGYDRMNSWVNDIEKQGIEAADRIIAVSYYTKNILEIVYQADPQKIDVVHNALEDIFYPEKAGINKLENDIKNIVFLGRVTFQKGPGFFVDAAEKVIQANKHVQFIMAGNGDMLSEMMDAVTEKGLFDYFSFTGFIGKDDVKRLLARADLYILPSVSEPFGISPLEAVGYGVPTIISKTAGVSEVLHNVLKVDFWDTDELANKILSVLAYPPLADEMVSQSDMDLEKISWDQATDSIVNNVYKVV